MEINQIFTLKEDIPSAEGIMISKGTEVELASIEGNKYTFTTSDGRTFWKVKTAGIDGLSEWADTTLEPA